MGKAAPNITEAEWAVLQVLWDQGPASVRQLADILYPRGGASEYATVHKLLERLEAKRCVTRERNEGVYQFRAVIERDDALGQQLETLVDRMCGGSLQPLLTSLVRTRRLSAAELLELLALVETITAKKERKTDKS